MYLLKNNLNIRKKTHAVHFFSLLVYLTLILLLCSQAASATNKLYRWVDDKGNVFFSDIVPPEQVKHERQTINENARVINSIDKEKTKKQKVLATRLKNLRQQQAIIIEKQKAHDKVLLSTYRNIDDMKLALKSKMSSFDGLRKLSTGNIDRLQKQLHKQQKQAAQFERDGRKVPNSLLEKITASKQQIELGLIDDGRKIEKKNKVRKIFEADIARFAFLTKTNNKSAEKNPETDENPATNELGLFVCQTDQQCHFAWKIAKKFVQSYSMTPLNLATDKLIMSALPSKDTELSLSVSKLTMENNKQQLFLDIRCTKSTAGLKLCYGELAQEIRRSFNRFITSEVELQTH